MRESEYTVLCCRRRRRRWDASSELVGVQSLRKEVFVWPLAREVRERSSGEYLNFVMTTYNTSNLIIHVKQSAARLPVCDVPVHHLIRLALLSQFATLHRGFESHSNNVQTILTALTAASLPNSLRSPKLIISPQTNLFSKSELHRNYISTHTTHILFAHQKSTH